MNSESYDKGNAYKKTAGKLFDLKAMELILFWLNISNIGFSSLLTL